MKFHQVQLARIALGASIGGAICPKTAPALASPAKKSTASQTSKHKMTKESELKTPLSMREVKSVFHRRARGNAYFTAQLRAELVEAGLKFVSEPGAADAILDTQGDYDGRAFSGQIKFSDRSGRVIWSHQVLRPAGSTVMAYRTLSQALRAARK